MTNNKKKDIISELSNSIDNLDIIKNNEDADIFEEKIKEQNSDENKRNSDSEEIISILNDSEKYSDNVFI